MNVLSKATLLLAVSGVAVFCQNDRSRNPQQLFSTPHIAAPSPTLEMIERFTGRMYNDGSSAPLSLLRSNYCSAMQATSATSRTSTPFSYTIAQDRLGYFPLRLGPLRYTFRPPSSQFNRPADGRLQKVVDGVLRHYTSHPVVPLNDRCVRSLSCASLYEEALRRRAVPSANK